MFSRNLFREITILKIFFSRNQILEKKTKFREISILKLIVSCREISFLELMLSRNLFREIKIFFSRKKQNFEKSQFSNFCFREISILKLLFSILISREISREKKFPGNFFSELTAVHFS